MRVKEKYIKLKAKKLFLLLSLLFTVIILHLSITGLILMLSGPLKLDQTYVKENIILKSYGLKTTKDVFYEKKHTDIIFYIAGNVYLNDEKITTFSSAPVGSVFTKDNKLIIADSTTIKGINLKKNQKENERLEYFKIVVFEKFDRRKKISLIGTDKEKNIYLYSGTQILIFDQDTNEIAKPPLPISPSEIHKEEKNSNLGPGKISWTCLMNDDCSIKPNQAILQKGLYLYQGSGIPMSQIIADMHNGKFFGYTMTILFFIAGFILNINLIINNIQKTKIVFQTIKKYLVYILKD